MAILAVVPIMRRLISSRYQPALISIIALFCLAAAQGIGSSVFARIGYLLLAVLGLSLAWAWLGIVRVQFTRELRTPRVMLGESVSELICVKTKVPWSVVEFCDDSLVPRLRQGFVTTAVRHPVAQEWYSVPVQRGYLKLGPSRLLVSDPFGLFRFERQFAAPHSVIVHPAILATAPLPVGQHDQWGRQQTGRRRTSQATTIIAVREYRTGDARNRIHWRTTAKRGIPMIKESTHEPSALIWLVFDAVQLSHSQAIDYEHGIQIAATRAHQWLAAGHAVGLLATGALACVVPPARGAHQRMLIMDALAMLVCDGGTPLAHAIPQIDWHGQRAITICVITADCTPAWVEALLYTTPAQSECLVVLVAPPAGAPPALIQVLDFAQITTTIVDAQPVRTPVV